MLILELGNVWQCLKKGNSLFFTVAVVCSGFAVKFALCLCLSLSICRWCLGTCSLRKENTMAPVQSISFMRTHFLESCFVSSMFFFDYL